MEHLSRFKESDSKFRIQPVPIYDTFKILVEVLENGSSQDVLLAHYCDEPLVQANKTDMDYMRYLAYLVADKRWCFDGPIERASLEALKGHNMLFFHLVRGPHQPIDIEKHMFKAIADTTRAMFANGAKTLDDIWLASMCPYAYSDFYHRHPGEHNY